MPRLLLALGLLTGAAVAGFGVLNPDGGNGLPPNAVARVNDQLILRDAWLRAVAAVASERNAPLTEADQKRILDRLIDEELLVQHGIALGLAERDARIRSELVSKVMLATRSMNATEPTAQEIQTFYEANRDFFTPPPRLRITAWRVTEGGRVPFQPPVPDALLPADKLQHYLGPALTRKAMQLQAGDRIETAGDDGRRIGLQVVERRVAQPPALADIHAQVRAELMRRADEAAVRGLLSQLRASERVQIAQDLQ